MKVITFGELMLRLSPPSHKKIQQSDILDMTFAGSEANVAVDLAYFGIKSSFVSVFPKNQLGLLALSNLKFHNVETTSILFKSGRLGLFFVEHGFSQRSSAVIYDRGCSVFSKSAKEDFNWESIFKEAKWFHVSGITPSLSDEIAEICEIAMKKAKELGLTVSLDINYRKKLWTKEKASKTIKNYLKYVDVLVGNEEDARVIFNYKDTNANYKALNVDSYKEVMNNIYHEYFFKKIYFTLRESINANKNKWSSIGFDGKSYYISKSYDIDIIDRFGAGDSFTSGIIYKELTRASTQEIIEFATAASCLKHTIHGDYNIITTDDVYDLIDNNGLGRVKR